MCGEPKKGSVVEYEGEIYTVGCIVEGGILRLHPTIPYWFETWGNDNMSTSGEVTEVQTSLFDGEVLF